MAAIGERRATREWRHERLLAWQTRTICEFVASTVEVAQGSENELLKQAQRIGRDDEPEQQPGGFIDPEPGSYERIKRLLAGQV